MKIHFKSIKWKNLFSYGNYWTEVSLEENKVTVIVGKNGCGKSTFCDALNFALFGKPYRKINLPQMVNSIIKKNMLVELIFSIGRDEYKIIRGLKPNILSFYKNGSLVELDSVRNFQEYIETDILHCNMKAFNQIVVLGSANYTAFLELPFPARRTIIENILDLEIFTSMNILMKEKADITEKLIKELQTKKMILEDRIKVYTNNQLKINSQYQNNIDEYQEQIDKLLLEIEELCDESVEISERNLSSKADELMDIGNKVTSIKIKKNEIDKEIKEVDMDILFYQDHEHCPVCHQNIDDEFRMITISGKYEKKRDLLSNDLVINESLKLLSEKQDNLEEEQEKFCFDNRRKNEIDRLLEEKQNQTIKLGQSIDKKRLEMTKNYSDEINKLNSELDNINNELNSFLDEKALQLMILRILKDDGIKAKKISQYMELINKLINDMLLDMNFLCQFSLDEEFNEVIKSRYRDNFTFENFSEGEKLRITLAILFTWREIARRRRSISTNLLIFDEILSGSLDNDGIQDLIKVLNTLCNDENIFLITHSDSIINQVENVLSVDKIKNFSYMK